MDFKKNDTCYRVQVNNALLKHQADGIDLIRSKIIERDNQLYVKDVKLLYSIGAKSYIDETDPEWNNAVMNLRDWSSSRIFHKELNKAQKEMIDEVFKKEKWL